MSHPGRVGSSASRRAVLLGGLGSLGALGASACGGGRTRAEPPRPAATSDPGATISQAADLQWAALGAALENLAVRAYAAVDGRAQQGVYGPVPAAVSRYLAAAAQQHREHALAWNELLNRAARPVVTGTPLTSAAGSLDAVDATQTVLAAMKVAGALESAAAATYLQVVGTAADTEVITLAATLAPVEAQHAAVLGLLLGTSPSPGTFLTTSSALKPSALTT